MSTLNPTNVTTGKVRLSYVSIFKPRAARPGQEEKYSVTILIPKSDTATKQRIDAAINAAIEAGVQGKWNGVRPPIIPNPLHDGDGTRQDGTPYGEECKGHWVMTASAKADYPPEVVDAASNPIISPAEVYSGCYGRVFINFFPYGGGGSGFKIGVGAGLGPVQKLEDGTPLGGSAPSASDVFGATPQTQNATVNTSQQINPLTGQPIDKPF